ncbi:MAG: MFS transporter [Acidimicrobiia bacterium]|nr:MAG: MFS transporter [Acidimicrobiia bacterium]
MSAQRVIGTYLVIAGLYTLSASLIWGVNTLFLLDAGLSVFEVFVANAAFTAGMVLFEVPTGVVADTTGRRRSFLWSVGVLLAATLAYVGLSATGAGVVAFSVVSMFLGLGYTFYSGAVEAWVVDALSQTDYSGTLDRVFTRGGIVTGAAMLVGTIGGGLLGTINLVIPYLVRSGLLVMVLIVAAVAMHDIGFEPRRVSAREYPAEMRRLASAGMGIGWGDRSVRLILTVTMFQMGIFTWVFYAWPPYFLDLLGSDAVWVAGFVAGGVAMSMIVGNALVEALTRFSGRRTTILLWASAVQGVAILLTGFAGSFWVAMPALLVATGTMGVISPVKQSYLNQRIPAKERATVLSIDSMTGSVGAVATQVGLGRVADAGNFSAGFVVAGLLSLIALAPLRALRRHHDAADHIEGGSPCPPGASCAQGLPDIAAVDSVPKREE